MVVPAINPLNQVSTQQAGAGRKFKKGLSFWMIKEDLQLLYKFKLAKDVGFDGIEFDGPVKFSKSELLSARDKTGVEVLSLVNSTHWSTPLSDPNPEVRQASISAIVKALDEVKEFGGNTLLVFPSAEMNLATSYGNFFRILGGYYSQQYAHIFGTSNYLDYSKFIISATRSSGTYTQLTSRVLKNLEIIREKATESEDWGTYLAATTLRVFTYQALVDAYGEMPYSEALDIANTAPHYDEGTAVYAGILVELNDALSKATPSSTVSANFLFGEPTAAEWVQFANSLKLKILMRISKVQDVKAELDQLITENNFATEDVAWDDVWANESGKANPFFQEEFATYFGSPPN